MAQARAEVHRSWARLHEERAAEEAGRRARAEEREQRIRERIERRRARDRAGLRRLRPGPGPGLGGPWLGGPPHSPRAAEDALDHEIEALARALTEQGPTERRDLFRMVGARYWGPGRFGAALGAAVDEGRVRRLSRRSYGPPPDTDTDPRRG